MTKTTTPPADPPLAPTPPAPPQATAQPNPGTAKPDPAKPVPKEVGGPQGPEPTRYGDWERKGRVSDF